MAQSKEEIDAKKKVYRDANKEKQKAYQKVYRDANKEKQKVYHKDYREANKEELLAKKKVYYYANQEHLLNQKKAYYEANKEELLAKQKDYKEVNKEKIKVYQKVYRDSNKEEISAGKAKRRALKRKQVPVHLRNCPNEKQRLVHIYKLRNILSEATGVQHHVDHMWPLNDGGPHWSGNLQVIPAEENLSKSASVCEDTKATIIKSLYTFESERAI